MPAKLELGSALKVGIGLFVVAVVVFGFALPQYLTAQNKTNVESGGLSVTQATQVNQITAISFTFGYLLVALVTIGLTVTGRI